MKKQLENAWDYPLIGILKYQLVTKIIININKNYLLIFLIKDMFPEKKTMLIGIQWNKPCLANEQVDRMAKAGVLVLAVERKKLSQWVFNITKFADELLG